MLFFVRATIHLPREMDAEVAERLKTAERSRALKLQADGQWVHLWRVVGRYESYSVFDVSSHEELHAILSALPLFPFMEVTVTALATHPSSLAAQGSDVVDGLPH